MNLEKERKERLEGIDLAETKEGDEVLHVDFHSKKCAHSFGRVTTRGITENGCGAIKVLCQARCSCGYDSGFFYPKIEDAKTKDNFDDLCRALPVYMQQPVDYIRDNLRTVMEASNLKLLFTVDRPKR